MICPVAWPAWWEGASLAGDRFPAMCTLFFAFWRVCFSWVPLVYWRCGVETRSDCSLLRVAQRPLFP